MDVQSKIPIVVIAGPTAVGKTALAIELRERLPEAEIISADSRQIFRFMNIGTAKPSRAQLRRHPHHCVDIKDPDEYFSAGEFGRLAGRICHEIAAAGKIPFVVGGSGLYIQSLIDGLFQGGARDLEIKKHLEQKANEEGVLALYDELKRVDPESAERIHFNDRQRILRALEVWMVTGTPKSKIIKTTRTVSPFNTSLVGVKRPRSHLYDIINKRVGQMVDSGLFEEVKELRAKGYHKNLQSQRTVGYQEVHSHLEGEIGFEDTIATIQKNTRHFAKRQLTWFTRDQRIRWFNIDVGSDRELALAYLAAKLETGVQRIEELVVSGDLEASA